MKLDSKRSILFLCAFWAIEAFAQPAQNLVPFSWNVTDVKVETPWVTVSNGGNLNYSTENEREPTIFGEIVKLPIFFMKTASVSNINLEYVALTIGLNVTNAKGVVLYFDKLQLAENAVLFVYSEDRKELLRVVASQNNDDLGRFAVGIIEGQKVVIELNMRKKDIEDCEVIVSEVGFLYQNGMDLRRGFGDADNCEVNVNCSEGAAWAAQRDATVRILGRNGSKLIWCTGTLLNNTRNNCEPYMLTAEHCLGVNPNLNDLAQWIFYFGFQSPSCASPSGQGTLANQSLVGASLVARSNDNGGQTGSDFLLLKLNQTPPPTYNAYYAGWTRSNTPTASGICIHHPEGDLKKISTFTTQPFSATFGGLVFDTHWQTAWSPTANGHGVTEGGSSGASLFSSAGLVMGTLTGGSSFCSLPNAPDLFGKFGYHWESNGTTANNRLKNWLDPDNTGVVSLGGAYLPCITVVGEKMLEAPNEGILYPNPADERFWVEGLMGDYDVAVTDAQGRLMVKTKGFGIFSTDVSTWARGFYVVRVKQGYLCKSWKLFVL